MRIEGRSERGNVRPNNEDALAICADHGLILLADGMGGAAAGEVASAEALAACRDRLRQALAGRPAEGLCEQLRMAVEHANQAVHELAQTRSGLRGMGTTLLAALCSQQRCYVAHVGDSRAYLWRGGALHQLTRDHSMVQQWVDAGILDPQDARRSPSRHIITRAIGPSGSVAADVVDFALQPGDLLLACTDGLTDMLSDAEISALCAAWADAGSESLSELLDQLIAAALAKGGSDNITVALALPG